MFSSLQVKCLPASRIMSFRLILCEGEGRIGVVG